MLSLLRSRRQRRQRAQTGDAPPGLPRPVPRKPTREWESVLLESLKLNTLAPTNEAILASFDLYQDDLYGPIMDGKQRLAGLVAEIGADVATLKAIAPHLFERAIARHPFEFPRIIEHREDA